jgi:hypothetical protein
MARSAGFCITFEGRAAPEAGALAALSRTAGDVFALADGVELRLSPQRNTASHLGHLIEVPGASCFWLRAVTPHSGQTNSVPAMMVTSDWDNGVN